ncbi:unnamed protein product [Aureobasidium pullulans]|nr:unnamed protein product [Aureobasidium pullulans]
MSGSAALEYGFPSTHSTNAVSVAFYFLYQLHTSTDDVASPQRLVGLCLGYFYAISIVLGRMYCGMHGFFDVIVGSTLGALIAVVQLAYGTSFDDWIAAGSWTHPALVFLIVLLAVRFHPEPADNCPCYDDSVAFAAVVLGCQLGHWHFAGTSIAVVGEPPATVFFSLAKLGWLKTLARVVGGVVIVFLWRATMKPLLLRCLPHSSDSSRLVVLLCLGDSSRKQGKNIFTCSHKNVSNKWQRVQKSPSSSTRRQRYPICFRYPRNAVQSSPSSQTWYLDRTTVRGRCSRIHCQQGTKT